MYYQSKVYAKFLMNNGVRGVFYWQDDAIGHFVVRMVFSRDRHYKNTYISAEADCAYFFLFFRFSWSRS